MDEYRRKFLVRTLRHFKYEQRERIKEKWYQDLVRRMMNNNLFKELWVESQKSSAEQDVMYFSTQTIAKKVDRTIKLLNFYFFLEPVFGDPRFFVELYTPADLQTFSYFQ